MVHSISLLFTVEMAILFTVKERKGQKYILGQRELLFFLYI